MHPGVLAVMLLGVVALGVVAFLFTYNAADRALNRAEREELAALRALLDDLKETAWDHRELDSALSLIMIDKIREHERRRRELGS